VAVGGGVDIYAGLTRVTGRRQPRRLRLLLLLHYYLYTRGGRERDARCMELDLDLVLAR